MYLTTTISVSLVLFLIGLECMVLMSARNLIRHVRENVVLTVVMQEDATSDEITRMQKLVDVSPYVLTSRYITKEEALQEHIETLGEDPEKFLGYNPLTDAFELRLKETYMQADSIQAIDSRLSSLPYVNRVIYHTDVINILDQNINKVLVVLLVVALVLLAIALVLIVNTIQLHIYAKRFLINTMRLVGATPWVIKWPFIRRNIWIGIEASVIACGLLAGVYYYCYEKLSLVLFELNYFTVGSIVCVVFLSGFAITFFASLMATNRYIRMKTNTLYEI
ncbi:MAG: permease-like cell division protein FtsX [Paludibacteraceae bacterium]|jgi:cell division transport system permease protein|nr:permease-like cell division protein FtsX [Paludibacteraceae bacterium]MBQ5774976.1 permease-like cell division protein FtsX [Paludibacteraceae bacterium]